VDRQWAPAQLACDLFEGSPLICVGQAREPDKAHPRIVSIGVEPLLQPAGRSFYSLPTHKSALDSPHIDCTELESPSRPLTTAYPSDILSPAHGYIARYNSQLVVPDDLILGMLDQQRNPQTTDIHIQKGSEERTADKIFLDFEGIRCISAAAARAAVHRAIH